MTARARNLRIGVASIVGSLLLIGAFVLPSCTGLPDKTCFGEQVNVFAGSDAQAATNCTTCMQTHCCDTVGSCTEDPTCAADFKATQECLVDGGPSEESACKGRLASPKSKELYECMRKPCGAACRVPSCDLDPAVILFATPSCDRCVGGACCVPINACYGSRGCKLIVECITRNCPKTLGPGMTALGQAPPGVVELATNEICRGSKPSVDPGACLARCLDEFAPLTDGTTTDETDARCLAFKVYACGAGSGCGPKCTQTSAGEQGAATSGGAWPQDLLDAGAD